VPLGSSPDWVAPAGNAAARPVVDASPFHLFSGPPIAAGGSETPFRFVYSGTYPLRDTTTGHKMTLGVDMARSARIVPHGQAVLLVWATISAPTGDGYDVQVKRPGSTSFTTWQSGVGSRVGSFTTNAIGRYTFRARLRNLATGAALAWSPLLVVHAD
jgi:hypothetical protein